jgi:hypothetical protein
MVWLPMAAALLCAMTHTSTDQTLEWRSERADGCKLVDVSPADVSSITEAAQAHFNKHAPDLFREHRLQFLRACRPLGDDKSMRVALSILVVSDVEAVYEMRDGEIREAYLLSYWR